MTDQILLDGLVLRSAPAGKIHAWIRKGFYGPPEFRGANDIIPGAAGEEFGAPWLAWKRTIVMPMQIAGSGATEALAQADFLALSDSVVAKCVASQAAPIELRVQGIYGVASGYRALNVRWVGSTEGDPVDGIRQLSELRFECVDSPPDWVAGP